MDEFALIQRYFNRDQGSPHVALALGDDCALLNTKADTQWAMSVDTLVEGVHFYPNIDSEKLAQRALAVSLSDLAAMAASPVAFLLSLTLPTVDEQWLEGFSRGLFASATRYGCTLAGGDTTRGPLAISITVMGEAPKGQAILRSGASEGDGVYVTGTLGDGAAGLAVINGEITASAEAETYLLNRYYSPEPQFEAASQLLGLASACLDISDGLLADLQHICKASGLGAHIDVDCLPLSPALVQSTKREQQYRWALSGGDDYQLCFTVPSVQQCHVDKLVATGQLQAKKIGHMLAGNELSCSLSGKPYTLTTRGYNHFGHASST